MMLGVFVHDPSPDWSVFQKTKKSCLHLQGQRHCVKSSNLVKMLLSTVSSEVLNCHNQAFYVWVRVTAAVWFPVTLDVVWLSGPLHFFWPKLVGWCVYMLQADMQKVKVVISIFMMTARDWILDVSPIPLESIHFSVRFGVHIIQCHAKCSGCNQWG